MLICSAEDLRQTQEWERTRNIELANYASTIGFNGKKAFKLKKPTDLYSLPTDMKVSNKPVKIDKDRQRIAINKHKKWLGRI